MSYKLVGMDLGYRPKNFIGQYTGPRLNRPAAFIGGASAPDFWSTSGGARPHLQNGLGMPTPYKNSLTAYQQGMRNYADTINKEYPNYLRYSSDAGATSLNDMGNVPGSLFVRGRTGGGDWVSIPAGKASLSTGRIPTPEELNYALRDAQLVKGGFGPLEGLLGVAGFGLGLPGGLLSGLIGKLPAGLQTAAKVAGGLKTGADLIRSKGRSGVSTLLGGLGSMSGTPTHPGIK